MTVRVTRAGTGPVVRLAAGPLKVRAGTARATIGCDARTAGGCTGVAIAAPGRPERARSSHARTVRVAAGRAHVDRRYRCRPPGCIALAPGAWRKATLIVVARDSHGNGGTLGRNIVLHRAPK